VELVNARLEANVLRRSLAMGVCDSVDATTPRTRRRRSKSDRGLAIVGWLVLIALLACSLAAAR